MVSDLPVINPEACADYYGSIIYSGIMCIDSAGGKGVCNVSIWKLTLGNDSQACKLGVYFFSWGKKQKKTILHQGDSGGTLNIRQSEGGNKWTQVDSLKCFYPSCTFPRLAWQASSPPLDVSRATPTDSPGLLSTWRWADQLANVVKLF